MNPNIHPNVFWVNIRTRGSQASICVRIFTQFTSQLLQFKLVGGFLAKSHFRHMGSCCIKGMHGFKQGLVRFLSWSKLQEHRLFHVLSLLSLNDNVNGQESPTTLAPNKERLFPPLPLKWHGFQRRSFCEGWRHCLQDRRACRRLSQGTSRGAGT